MSNAITTPTIDSVISSMELIKSFNVNPYGLDVLGTPNLQEYMDMGYMLGQVRGALSWVVGDYLNSFETHHGELMAQAEAMFPEKSYQYMMDCKWVSSKVEIARRFRGSWSAWKEVLALEHKEQNKLLKDYEDGVLPTQKDLRLAVRELQGIAPVQEDSYGYIKKIIKELEKWHDTSLNKKHAHLLLEAINILKEIRC